MSDGWEVNECGGPMVSCSGGYVLEGLDKKGEDKGDKGRVL